MTIIVREDLCPQNHHCPSLRVCPTGALSQDGYGAPRVDEALCTGCGRCLQSCPVFTAAGHEPRQQAQLR